MLKRRWLWGAGGVAVVAVAVLAAVKLRAPEVDAFVVQEAPLVRTLQFSARVATLSRVNVGATLTGRVARVSVDEGAQVRRGDVLVQLETAELQAAVAQASAAERQAQARLAGLRSTGRTSAGAGLLQAQATLRAAEAELARTQQLVKQGFLSEARLDEVQRAMEVARAQVAGAQAQARANEESGTDVTQAQA